MTSAQVRARLDGPVLSCAAAVLVVGLFHRLVPADSDTPWHLAQGRLLLQRWADGAWGIGRSDSFSWTARGLPWHPNSWAFDAVVAAIYDLGGWAGIAVLRLGLLASLAALAWRFSRRSGAGRWARAGAVWVSLVLAVPPGAMRPQLVSFVLVLAVLELTAGIGDLGPRRAAQPWLRLLALAATVSVWSSLHGAVIVGVAVVGAMCAGHVLDGRDWKRPAVTSVVAMGASWLSPLGISVWTYALRNGGQSRREGIAEWQPPSVHRPVDVVSVLFLVVVLGWSLTRLRGERAPVPWVLVLPAVLTTVLTFLATRNSTFAVLTAVPLASSGLAAVGSWLRRRAWAIPVRPGPAIAAMTVGALMAGAVQAGGLTLGPDPMGDAKFPSAAAALPGGCRLLNEYSFGGYLILARPDIPVSQDGRNDLYGPVRLAGQAALLSDARSGATALDRIGVSCVLAEPGRPLLRSLAGDPRWRLAAADATAQAWVASPDPPVALVRRAEGPDKDGPP